METAPIALFVYNRPRHIRQTVESLRANELAGESDLYIFSDGPKSAADEAAVREVRDYIRAVAGFNNLIIIEREKNWGLADSIIEGVSRIVNTYGRVIVLEDDIVTSKWFLKYMNDALRKYSKHERVMSISGYSYPLGVNRNFDQPFFFRQPSSWGWATWARSWSLFEKDVDLIISRMSREMRHQFDIEGSYPFYRMLKLHKSGKVNSWAIRWYASVFLHEGLCLYPPKSFARNIGFDGTGVHCRKDSMFDANASDLFVKDFPDEINESEVAFDKIRNFFWSKTRYSGLKQFLVNLEQLLWRAEKFLGKCLVFPWLAIKSLAIRYGTVKTLPGSEFDNFGRKLSIRFLVKGELDHFAKMLCNPVSIVRYFEFPFVHESADWGSAKRCLDISSPRLLFVFLMKRYPDLHFDIVNPDSDDLRETDKYLEINKLDARAAVHNIDATERLPFPDQYFDIITSVSVFEHIPGDGDGIALQQAWRTLKPGGLFVLTFPCAREYHEEFRSEDVYGLNSGNWKKEYFFQRIYNPKAIDNRLSAAINTKPLFTRIYGEKDNGFYLSYEARWMQHGLKETVKDPYYISRYFKEFQSIDKMPGLGVCGLVFKKES